jgi:hypothetical protein
MPNATSKTAQTDQGGTLTQREVSLIKSAVLEASRSGNLPGAMGSDQAGAAVKFALALVAAFEALNACVKP